MGITNVCYILGISTGEQLPHIVPFTSKVVGIKYEIWNKWPEFQPVFLVDKERCAVLMNMVLKEGQEVRLQGKHTELILRMKQIEEST